MVAPSFLRRTIALVLAGAAVTAGGVFATSAAQAAPGAPVIQTPLDDTLGIFSVTVEPVPSALPQTVQVYYRNIDVGVDVEGCQVAIPANPSPFDDFACDVIVPPGAYGFYELFAIASDVDGDSPPSNTISTVRYGGAADPGSLVLGFPLDGAGDPIDVVSQNRAITVTGQAPALSSVDLFGYPAALGPGAFTYLGGANVDATGVFSFAATLPGYGLWEIRALTTDIMGTSIDEPPANDTISVFAFPDEPTLSVTPLDGAFDVTVDGFATSTVGAALTIDPFSGGGEARACPASWDAVIDNPSSVGPSASCTLTLVPPGVHQLESVQWADGVTGDVRTDLVYVPGTPTLTVQAIPGGAIYSGTFDPQSSALTASGTQILENQIEVIDSTDNVRCFSAVDPGTGAWSCWTPEPAGDETFVAVARSNGFADDPSSVGSVDGYHSGVSARSAPVLVTIPASIVPPPPTMAYRLGAASIDVQATGVPNSAVAVRLYQVEDIPGEPYQYGDPVGECGLPDPDDGGGFPLGLAPTAPSSVDTCSFTGLAPGIWNVFSSQYLYYEASDNRDHYVLIPSAPTMSAPVAEAGRITPSGQGTPGHRVIVREVGGSAACTATVATNGAWSCSIAGVSGEFALRAQQQSQGFVATPPPGFGVVESFDGYSAFSAPISVVVPPLLATAAQPLSWTLNGYSGGPLTPGQVLDLSAEGLPPQTEIDIEIQSTPQLLGSTTADDLGAMALSVTIPLDIEPGDHTLVATATPPGGEPSVVSIPVTVVTAEQVDEGAAAAPPEQVDGAAQPGSAGGTVDRADPAAPSAISDSIPTIDRIFRTPLLVVTAGGLALAILLLVAFPAELLNNTIAENGRRVGRWYAGLNDRLERFTEWFARVTRSRALAAALLVSLTAVIFGFVDPNYGFDPVSLRMTASLAIGLFVVTYVASWISGAIISRVWQIPTRVGLQPAALLFAVFGVIIARLLDFSPGFLIGLVIGLDVLTRVGAPYRVRVLMTNLSVTVGLALTGWIGFSVLAAVSTGEPSWFEMLINDALVATAAEGLTAALASMLPLGFLAGHEIARHSRLLWVVSFAIVATLFALIVLPTAEGEVAVADIGFWLVVMVIFAVVVLALWAALHFTAGDEDDDETADDRPAETAGAAR